MKFTKVIKANYNQENIKLMQECFEMAEKYLKELSDKKHNDEIQIAYTPAELEKLSRALSSVSYELEQAVRNLPDWK